MQRICVSFEVDQWRMKPFHPPSFGGISSADIFLAWIGHSLAIVSRNSSSFLSISSAGPILMLSDSRINANSVVVKWTVMSSATGIFIRINFWKVEITDRNTKEASLDVSEALRLGFQYPKRRLVARFHKVSKPQDLYLKLSNCSDIWQAHQQHCCWCNCQFSKRCKYFNTWSRLFKTLWDLTIRHLIGYWNRVQQAAKLHLFTLIFCKAMKSRLHSSRSPNYNFK